MNNSNHPRASFWEPKLIQDNEVNTVPLNGMNLLFYYSAVETGAAKRHLDDDIDLELLNASIRLHEGRQELGHVLKGKALKERTWIECLEFEDIRFSPTH